MSEPEFHQLRVTEVSPLTEDSVAVTFDVPDQLSETFAYLPGQHVTVRAFIADEDVRRSYSICANANSDKLRVGIKRLPGGAFSTYATSDLKAGDVLDVMAPVGDFTIEIDPSSPRRAVAIAVGSGITPVISLIATSLESEPFASWTLLFGNRTANSIMFLEELEGLKDRYRSRFQLFHLLSREGSDLPLLSGRIDENKIRTIHDRLLGNAPVDDWYLCGPYEVVMMARQTLRSLGVAEEAIHDELFFAGPVDSSTLPPEPPPGEGTVELTVILDGRSVDTRMSVGTSILDAALRVRSELPFSCKGGMCATCKGRIEEGEVTMEKNYALIDEEVEAGYVLTCQSHPVSDRVVVRYDHR
ncbi:MAG: phenylacetate-CoA oxygenase/reductase subunit PaaK [Acidobacteria bacterium]|nr:phenylacetate-CoA oxygenase/reductase subunit PaaK [Acidobacteriota bacterium]TDI51442.1 MAG: phenylacetate-CoA oxygenase/reductase subunit PaaK [Acidobacteriota bacterium]TDI57424.1 MAG: phenylacetate-CoA oxygenase/reductase subunit PaaK [Acidobacteriota bacterium]